MSYKDKPPKAQPNPQTNPNAQKPYVDPNPDRPAQDPKPQTEPKGDNDDTRSV